MNVEEIFQQVINENCKDPLHRFAELVRQDEREKWGTSDMAYRPGGLSVERPVKSYTGGDPQYATDAPKHEDDDIQEYKRPWVGLTDEERCTFVTWLHCQTINEIFNAIEAKLKERNGG